MYGVIIQEMLNIYSQSAFYLLLCVELPSVDTSNTQTTPSTQYSSAALSPNAQVRLSRD